MPKEEKNGTMALKETQPICSDAKADRGRIRGASHQWLFWSIIIIKEAQLLSATKGAFLENTIQQPVSWLCHNLAKDSTKEGWECLSSAISTEHLMSWRTVTTQSLEDWLLILANNSRMLYGLWSLWDRRRTKLLERIEMRWLRKELLLWAWMTQRA